METSDKIEQLYLLEVLIDKVVLKDLPPETPIRLRVKFIEFPCFEITPEDFKKDDNSDTDGVNFNSGKSFLFPMVPLELIRNLQRHPLAVTVFQVKEDAPLLPEIVGQTRVRMSEGMSEAVFAAMSCSCDSELPVSHTLTDTFSLRNMGDEVGTIALFIRLSCFGQSIVTQFQLMGEKKAFLFKNSKADNSFKCKKSSNDDDGNEPTKFDVLPVAPFLTSEDNVCDMYSPTGDADDSTVTWKVTPPTPAPCPTCETRPGCNPPPKCPPKPPVQNPCPKKKPGTPPCSKCGGAPKSQKPSAESKNPCSVCGSNPVPAPAPSKSPCNKCGSSGARAGKYDPQMDDAGSPCGTAFEFGGSFDSSNSSKKSFVCAFCGTKKPPNKATKICSICGSPQSEQAKTCNVCGTRCPFTVKQMECSICGMTCPGDTRPSEADVYPPVRYDTTGALSSAFMGWGSSGDVSNCTCDDVKPTCGPTSSGPPPVPVRYNTTGALSPAFMGYGSSGNVGNSCNCNGDDDKPSSVPVRYNTTGALSPAFMGYGSSGNVGNARKCSGDDDKPSSVPVRYNTTGALSPAFMGWGSSGDVGNACNCDGGDDDDIPSPVLIRYDTTGALSPAFMGWGSSGDVADACNCDEEDQPSPVPVRYDTTGALSPAFMGWGSSGDVADPCSCDEPSFVRVRYDTTGALSPAFMGWPEKPPEPLPPSPCCQCGGEDGDFARHSGQGDGDANAGFFASSPVWQTGSAPDVMQAGAENVSPDAHVRPKTAPKAQPAKKKKRRSKWTHKWGLQYPGIKFGHRNCCEQTRQVPPEMGWLWTKPSVGHKYHKGWKPGAVGPTISKLINQHREASGRPPLGQKSKAKWKSGRGGRGGKGGKGGPQPPTLHIHRREGAYYISMHPLDLGPDAVNVPLQFKIPKREREEGDSSSSSSEESELEIEFMAPGAFEEKEPPPEFKNTGTQYLDEDTNVPKAASSPKVGKGKKNKGGSTKGSKKGKKGK